MPSDPFKKMSESAGETVEFKALNTDINKIPDKRDMASIERGSDLEKGFGSGFSNKDLEKMLAERKTPVTREPEKTAEQMIGHDPDSMMISYAERIKSGVTSTTVRALSSIQKALIDFFRLKLKTKNKK